MDAQERREFTRTQTAAMTFHEMIREAEGADGDPGPGPSSCGVRSASCATSFIRRSSRRARPGSSAVSRATTSSGASDLREQAQAIRPVTGVEERLSRDRADPGLRPRCVRADRQPFRLDGDAEFSTRRVECADREGHCSVPLAERPCWRRRYSRRMNSGAYGR